ncbi:TetR/AcrR family transcriptional regulator [Brevibacterium oceani]|uniref:TetR/AcrR family transcriptional regulator n=1 Tax=Brevibacterium oceani TaxID=358099 RepID=UPI001B321CD0|nr:TetR/AcrR family transcriptional regulator [Brevibacterium oceani]
MSSKVETQRRRNPRGEGGRLREDIVAGAAALLDQTGESGAVTLRAIARSVGIAAPSIYRHFDSHAAIMFAVVEKAFSELESELRSAVVHAGEKPRDQLLATCRAYLRFAAEHPGPYRAMFGGVWIPELDETITEQALRELGATAMGLLQTILQRCVETGVSTSQNSEADAVALWLGLHGIAHQRSSTRIFPGPEGIENRMITALAHLD